MEKTTRFFRQNKLKLLELDSDLFVSWNEKKLKNEDLKNLQTFIDTLDFRDLLKNQSFYEIKTEMYHEILILNYLKFLGR